MLKFATKKPPRLKHFDKGNISEEHGEGQGHIYSGKGQGHWISDEQFDNVNGGQDSLDSGNKSMDLSPRYSHNMNSPSYSESTRMHQGRGAPQQISEKWKAYNVKYGKIGVETEIQIPTEQPVPQVGRSRNEHQNVGQRSPRTYGFPQIAYSQEQADMNRNLYQVPATHGLESQNYPKGSGYHYPSRQGQNMASRSGNTFDPPRGHTQVEGHDQNGNRQFQYINGQMHSPNQPIPTSHSMSTDSNGNYGSGTSFGHYGQPWSDNSTASMSIDSMSTTGDRSSKSTSETQDYDMLMEMPQVVKRGMVDKPPVVPAKQRHVHIGRGTHGLCEGAPGSQLRPGSMESHMTSSMRKSPSYRSGHHVRWGPGVVNSGHKVGGHELQGQGNPYLGVPSKPAEIPPVKKVKKKTSLRTLLNLPKFPVSDEDLTDYGSDTGHPSKTQHHVINTRSTAKNKNLSANIRTEPKTELACLRYKSEFSGSDKKSDLTGDRPQIKDNLPKLNITSANEHQFHSMFSLPERVPLRSQGHSHHQPEKTMPSETSAIKYPIMHSGSEMDIAKNRTDTINRMEAINRAQVNSVRPFLINGQANKMQDYDNFDENLPQKSLPISVTASHLSNGATFSSPTSVSFIGSNDKKTQNTNVGQGVPVTFDTFATLGRPSEASVTFDTFVTHGRPYATSTPIPNGNLGYAQNLGQEFHTFNKNKISGEDEINIGRTVTSCSHVFSEASGPFSTTVTQSWNYSPNIAGTQLVSSVPFSAQPARRISQEPVMLQHPVRSHVMPLMSHDSNVTRYEQSDHVTVKPRTSSGPYEMENRVYGKLSVSSPIYTSGKSVFANSDSSNQRSHDQPLNKSQQVLTETDQSAYKDRCTYHHMESPDYDDAVFNSLAPLLGQGFFDSSRSARRKLNFEGQTTNGMPVVTSCVPQLNHELNQDVLNQNYSGYPKVQAVPGIAQQRSPMSSNLNEMVQRGGDHTDGETDCILDLVYITERIISMSFASEEHETTYKYNLKEVTRMLKTKHQENYLVINISDKRPDLAKHCPQVLDYGWPEHLAPPLERLCSICKAIDSWLGSDMNHVVVVHCKGGRGRIAVVIAAYMRYSNICASADQALDRFAMKRFYDDKLGGLPQPSQRRYVHYFAGLLSGAIQINSSALYLHHILIHGVPNFDTKGGCRPFIKVYQGMHPIFTSGVYNVTDNMQKVCISISPGIPLRGDILIKCYHKKNAAGQREIMWGCQFHTCAISHNSLVFSKNELDDAITDPRFPDPGKVEFIFGNNSEGLVQVSDFKSDVTVPVDDTTEALTRWDSYENFGKDGKDVNANGIRTGTHNKTDGVDSFRVTQSGHSTGPVDGSLYAQINKRTLESQIITNGGTTTKLHNGGSGGSYQSSQDSGISAFSAPMGMTTTNKSSESWSYNTKDRDYNQPNMSYSTSSVSPRSGKVTLDEQTQLDQILSDLLQDQGYVSQKSPSQRGVVSETRSFKTVEDHISPEGNVVVQRSDVTYKLPGEQRREEKHYTVKTETKTIKEDKSYKPVNAFTYTPPSPEMSRSFEPIRSPGNPKTGSLPYRTDYENNYKKEQYSYEQNGPPSSSFSDGEHSVSWLQQQQAKLRDKSVERDPKRAQNERMMLEELRTAQTQNKYFAKRSQSEEEALSKSPLSNGPTSPYSYTVSRTHTYNSEKTPNETFRPHDNIPIANSHTTYITEHGQKVSQKPPPSPSLQRTVTTTTSVPVPPPQRTSSKDYMQHQHQSRGRNHSGGSYQTSTSAYKTETQTQPRVVQRHYSESAYDREQYEKQHAPKSYTTPPISPRSVSPQTYQTYKTVYKTIHHRAEDEPDFVKPVEVQMEQQTTKQQHTVQQQQQQEVNKPHYITEVIVQRTGGSDSKDSTLNRSEQNETDNRLEALEKSLAAASNSIMQTSPWQQQQQQQQQESRRYETHTYETKSEHREERQQQQSVSRVESSTVNGGYPRSMSPVWDNLPTQHVQQTQSEAPPLIPPKKIEVIEEDRIALKPIGPGVQQLEPEGSHVGTLGRDSSHSTLGRATTPSFPTSPTASAEVIIQAVHEKARRMSIGSNQSLNSVGYQGYPATPPFPTTPRTPYQNISSVSTNVHHHPGYAPRYPSQTSPSPRYQTSPYNYGGSSVTGHYSSQQSINSSVFDRDVDTNNYNSIVSRQLLRSANDPTYAYITDEPGNVKGGGHVISPTGTLSSDKMQYQYAQNQQYQTQTLPHGGQPASLAYQTQPTSLAYQSSTLPHQSNFQQQKQQQHHTSSSSSSQQYHTQQYSTNTNQSSHNGSLHVDTHDPRMLMTHPARSPNSPGSPPSPGNLNNLRQQLHIANTMSNSAVSPGPHSATGQSSPSVYFGLSRRGSLTSLADSEAVANTPKFVKDTSKFWYKQHITREEAIMLLKDKAPGTFVVRDSNSFPGAFGLALKVATLPPNVQTKTTGDPQADLVRHFLIEPTSKGVRLRGCSNEPVFGSLASLVYQHSMTPLALPCKLVLPEHDPSHIIMTEVSPTTEMPSSATALLHQGAACNVLFLNSVDTESLTGPQAVAKAMKMTFEIPPPKITVVHFKVSNQGITLTDNQRKLFFRRHYPVAAVTYCGMDPEDRKWRRETDVPNVQVDAKVFGFVARKQGSATDNCCHLFAELDPDQPASAIVNFVMKIMIGTGKVKS